MSNDGLIIRHVRLCQCGKPAGHDSVCRNDKNDPDGIRLDEQAENVLAERARARYQRRKREFDTERRTKRAQLTTYDLHKWIIEHVAKISTVKSASNDAPTRGGEPDHAPAQQQTLDDDPRWREHWNVIRRRLELAAEIVDEAQGHSTVASTMNMLSDEKDKLIVARENEGLSAQGVVDRLGSHIAGSARTVQRVRSANGLDGRGHPKQTAD